MAWSACAFSGFVFAESRTVIASRATGAACCRVPIKPLALSAGRDERGDVHDRKSDETVPLMLHD